MTSLYMPDVVVEIAFGSGYSTPAASRVWTDVSDYVESSESVSIGFGRGDERATADANTLSLTLDNTDGRFTALRAASPYYPDVKIGTPIRVTSTPPGGSPSVRFVGFVEEWPLSWDGSDDYAMAQISASSRLARVGLNASLRSIIEETYLVDDPSYYYPLSEPEGATQASDTSGNNQDVLVSRGSGTAVSFGTGTGPGTDGLTAAVFSGGQYLAARSGGRLSGVGTIEMSVNSASDGTLLTATLGSVGAVVSSFSISVAGTLVTVFVQATNGNTAGVTTLLFPGSTTHIAFTFGSTVRLYLNGVQVDTASLSGSVPLGAVQLGRNWSGTMSHVAFYPTALSAARIADHAAAGVGAFAGEATDERLIRYASFADVASTEISAEAGSTTCAHVDPTDSTAIDMMRRVEATEGGVLFDAPDGTLTFHNRGHRYDPPTTLTLDMAAQLVGADFSPKLDRSALINDVTAQNVDGTIVAHVLDADSREYYGPASASLETMSLDDDEPVRAATWLLASHAEPKMRAPSVTVNLLDFDGSPSQNDVLDATVGTLVTVTNQPAQADATAGEFFVEGYTETIGPESYEITFNLSPAEPFTRTVKFDAAGRGFDTGYVFAY